MSQRYAVFLQPTAPPELFEVFDEYLLKHGSLNYLLCVSVEPSSNFCEFSAVNKDTLDRPWKVQIPFGYVLAIVDVTKGKHPPGFLPDVP